MLRRHATALTKDPTKLDQWQPADIVYFDLNGNNLLHVGIVSDRTTREGRPLIIHNCGPHATEADVLPRWQILAHYRLLDVGR